MPRSRPKAGSAAYLLTGDQIFLEPYTPSLAKIPQLLARLQTLTADNPIQQARVSDIDERVTALLLLYRDSIDSVAALAGLPAGAAPGNGLPGCWLTHRWLLAALLSGAILCVPAGSANAQTATAQRESAVARARAGNMDEALAGDQ
ncbi:hypothetical protein BH11PSE3_BH11PSE3_29020 [soil metagenome]